MGVRSTGSQHPTTTEADGHLLEYFRQNFSAGGGGSTFISETPSGMTASGGIVNDYTSSGKIYRAHTFTSSGTFSVSDETSDFGSTVEYVVVAGGGSGPHENGGGGGGGGAGGYRSSVQGESSGGGGSAEAGGYSGGSGIVLIAYPT